MCRAIKTLHHFEPPATLEEVQASALQYVRKLSGMHTPSKANRAAFEEAIHAVTHATLHLFAALEPHGPPRDREEEKRKAKERGKKRDAEMRVRLGRTAT